VDIANSQRDYVSSAIDPKSFAAVVNLFIDDFFDNRQKIEKLKDDNPQKLQQQYSLKAVEKR
jgi:hypothetical protein